jgi:hypothetical protein
MNREEDKALNELLGDAVTCPRLSDWEEGFLANIRIQLARQGSALLLSDKQREALKRIEAKVYAT